MTMEGTKYQRSNYRAMEDSYY